MNSRRERSGLGSTGCMVAFISDVMEQAVGPLVPHCPGPQVDLAGMGTRATRGRPLDRRCRRSFQPAHGFENRCIRVEIRSV